MAGKATGQVIERRGKDGVSYGLRFPPTDSAAP